MKKKLYLMRHGETQFNKLNKIQGWCDSPLTEHGIHQAKTAKQHLEHIDFDHYYSSTSERCCDTMEFIIEDKEYKRVKGLREMSFGLFESESQNLNPKSPKEYEDFFVQYGGESAVDVRDRMTTTLTEIMEREDHTNVLSVSSGGACFRFLWGLQDPMEELKKGFGNCTIFVFDYENKKFTLNGVIRPTF